jgi:hypothetical protein
MWFFLPYTIYVATGGSPLRSRVRAHGYPIYEPVDKSIFSKMETLNNDVSRFSSARSRKRVLYVLPPNPRDTSVYNGIYDTGFGWCLVTSV